MNNNENQNMNLNGVGMNPTPSPMPMPMDNNLQNANSMPQMVTPNVTEQSVQSVSSQPEAPVSFGTAPMGTLEQPIGAPVSEPMPQPVEGLQLQPEGTVIPEPVNTPVQNGPQPLMGATLNDQTILNSTVSSSNNMNSFGSPAPNTPPVSNMNMGMNPMPTNNMGMMGGVPAPPTLPPADDKKKKMNTPLLIILIVVLIAAVGFGIYYFLFASKKKAPSVVITPVLTEIELGNDLENDPKYFARVTGMDISNCKIDTNVDYNKAGTYTYSVTCGNKQSTENKVIVKDTVEPDAVLKDVVVLPNATVTVEDFIEEIIDASPCSYEFKNPIDTTKEGEFDIEIILTDAYGNESVVTGFLLVDSNAPQYYLVCEHDVTDEEYENAKIVTSYRYGISSSGEYFNSSKETTYTFSSEEEYSEALENMLPTSSNSNTRGKIAYDEEMLQIRVSEKSDPESLGQEFNLTPFPTGEFDIENHHLDNGGSCTIENN